VGHKLEKQSDFYGEAKDKPERTKRVPVRIIRFNSGAHGRAISDLRNLTLYDFDSRPAGHARQVDQRHRNLLSRREVAATTTSSRRRSIP
jgi:hypothetical protein